VKDWVKGRVVAKRQWNHRLFSMQIDAEVDSFKAGQFTQVALDVGDERIGRPYSLVNPPQERPLEIYFNAIPEGPLTPRLSDLNQGDTIWVSAKAAGIFTMDAMPPARDLWLIATGTALGVYLSILRTADPWERFERIFLVHGVRSADELTYADTLGTLRATYGERFSVIPSLSREHREGMLHGRIPPLLTSGELEDRAGTAIEVEHSHLMLCGQADMIKDVRTFLEGRGMRRHRRNEPGHYTTEQYH
jgi:ferredoxin/flavodoxin---NADP+ reductase